MIDSASWCFTVWIPKSSGVRVPFQHYPTRGVAVQVAAALQHVGLAAAVEYDGPPQPEAPG